MNPDKRTWLLPRLSVAQITLGTFVQIPSAALTEYLAALPFDFLCIDAEHSPFDVAAINTVVAAADLHAMPCIVRVAGVDPVLIKQALDAGAAGIMAPCIETEEQVRAVVMAARFPPLGQRGCGPGRAAGYGRNIVDYVKQADANVVVIVQIETRAAVQNLDGILTVEGVDMLFIGPGDLSIAYRAAPGDKPVDPAPLARRIVEKCKKAGMMTATFAGGIEDAQLARESGMDAVVLASDMMFAGLGASQALLALGRDPNAAVGDGATSNGQQDISC